MPVLVVFLVVMAVLHHPDEKRYRVPSQGMEPTIHVGDHVTAELDAYDHADPQAGDVVVFHPPAAAAVEAEQCGAPVREGTMCQRPKGGSSDVSFIKRIVGEPGDRLALRDCRVIRNGHVLDEPYVAPAVAGGECDFPRTITVPRGMYFVLGDNRGASDDSRFWGPVPKSAIVGRVKGH